jgi:hypothetical protein
MSNYPGEFARCQCGREAFYRQWGDRANEVDDFYCEGCDRPTDECPCEHLPGYEDDAGAGEWAAVQRALGEG